MRSRAPRAPIAALLALALLACGERAEPWPEGASIVAERDALAGVLARLAALEPAPLGRRARELAAALPDCPLLEARAGRLGDALAGLACAEPSGPLARVHALRGERQGAFAVPLEGAHWVGTLATRDAGGVEIELRVPANRLGAAKRLLLPGSGPVGPGLLSADGALIHARVRPEGGLDLASLVPPDSQGARLFRLRSRLFSGLVLDGTWEAVVYPPARGRDMPDAALALGFSRRDAAAAAMEEFIAELTRTWPVRRSPFALGDAEGACLLDVVLLPELAPCYVATERALVVGWNPESLRRAIESAGPHGPDGALVVDLARMGEVDRRLAEKTGDADPPVPSWPWRRLHADGARQGDAVHLRVVLESEGAS